MSPQSANHSFESFSPGIFLLQWGMKTCQGSVTEVFTTEAIRFASWRNILGQTSWAEMADTQNQWALRNSEEAGRMADLLLNVLPIWGIRAASDCFLCFSTEFSRHPLEESVPLEKFANDLMNIFLHPKSQSFLINAPNLIMIIFFRASAPAQVFFANKPSIDLLILSKSHNFAPPLLIWTNQYTESNQIIFFFIWKNKNAESIQVLKSRQSSVGTLQGSPSILAMSSMWDFITETPEEAAPLTADEQDVYDAVCCLLPSHAINSPK